MRASWNGTVLAESDDTVVVEGNHYFPVASVDPEILRGSGTHTRCAWKGEASYYDLVVGDDVNRDGAWYYREPMAGAEMVTDRLAFGGGVEVGFA